MAQTRTSKKAATSKLSTINQLIDKLSFILTELLSASRTTDDPAKLMQISAEYKAVQTCLDQAAKAQAAANDELFKQAANTLKTQATMLEDMEKHIKKIIADVAVAGRIIGYIGEALTLVGTL